jgi:hypothetical protein
MSNPFSPLIPPLEKGKKGGKISPHPSLLKRGIKEKNQVLDIRARLENLALFFLDSSCQRYERVAKIIEALKKPQNKESTKIQIRDSVLQGKP